MLERIDWDSRQRKAIACHHKMKPYPGPPLKQTKSLAGCAS
jgi:hypothetical protein